jgi:molybdenum cofactor cytidylyltransferase
MRGPVTCVIPAAGRSQRMGGRWKPLLPFGASTIAGTVVAAALGACDRVILVAGWRGDELAAAFGGLPRVTVVENPAWEQGMLGSVRRGVEAAGPGPFFVTPADMPWITPAVYERLLDADGEVVFPVHGGRRGHPVLFGAAAREAVMAPAPGVTRMRDIAERFDIVEVPWDDDAILRDIDTEEEYT